MEEAAASPPPALSRQVSASSIPVVRPSSSLRADGTSSLRVGQKPDLKAAQVEFARTLLSSTEERALQLAKLLPDLARDCASNSQIRALDAQAVRELAGAAPQSDFYARRNDLLRRVGEAVRGGLMWDSRAREWILRAPGWRLGHWQAEPQIEVEPYGSAANGLEHATSDVDVVIVGYIPDVDTPISGEVEVDLDEVDSETSPVSPVTPAAPVAPQRSADPTKPVPITVSLLSLLFRRRPDLGFTVLQSIPMARVPVLKARCEVTGFNIDLCINNPVTIQNTALIRSYANLHPFICRFLLLLKLFSKRRRINDPAGRGTPSSYCWTLVGLCFLVENGFVPNLQEVDDSEEKNMVRTRREVGVKSEWSRRKKPGDGDQAVTANASPKDGSTGRPQPSEQRSTLASDSRTPRHQHVLPPDEWASYDCTFRKHPPLPPSHQMPSPTSLFLSFIAYFLCNAPRDAVFSLRLGGCIPREEGPPAWKWKAVLCVEDPFIGARNTGASCKPESLHMVLIELERAVTVLYPSISLTNTSAHPAHLPPPIASAIATVLLPLSDDEEFERWENVEKEKNKLRKEARTDRDKAAKENGGPEAPGNGTGGSVERKNGRNRGSRGKKSRGKAGGRVGSDDHAGEAVEGLKDGPEPTRELRIGIEANVRLPAGNAIKKGSGTGHQSVSSENGPSGEKRGDREGEVTSGFTDEFKGPRVSRKDDTRNGGDRERARSRIKSGGSRKAQEAVKKRPADMAATTPASLFSTASTTAAATGDAVLVHTHIHNQNARGGVRTVRESQSQETGGPANGLTRATTESAPSGAKAERRTVGGDSHNPAPPAKPAAVAKAPVIQSRPSRTMEEAAAAASENPAVLADKPEDVNGGPRRPEGVRDSMPVAPTADSLGKLPDVSALPIETTVDNLSCQFFARTGWCGYGKRCRYTHGVQQANASGSGQQRPAADTESGAPEAVPGQNYGQLAWPATTESLEHAPAVSASPGDKTAPCKFFARNGRCRLGDRCKYTHGAR